MTREDVERLHQRVMLAWEHAGTIPAKSAVKVRPEDWHAIRRQVEDLHAALAAQQPETLAWAVVGSEGVKAAFVAYPTPHKPTIYECGARSVRVAIRVVEDEA